MYHCRSLWIVSSDHCRSSRVVSSYHCRSSRVSGNTRPTCPWLPADARHPRLQLHVVGAGEEVLVGELGEGGRGGLVEASLAAGGDIVLFLFYYKRLRLTCSWWAPATSPPSDARPGKKPGRRATVARLPGNNCTCSRANPILRGEITFVPCQLFPSAHLGCNLQRRCSGRDTRPSLPLERGLSRVHVQGPELN